MSWEFREEAEVLEALARYFRFPTTYLVLDTETTGFSKTDDFLVDVGWAVVQNGRIVNHTNLLLDWSKLPGIDHNFIRNRLLYQAEQYRQQGRPHYYSWERLCAEGHHPLEVIHSYAHLIYEHITRGDSMLVGHGFWRFDRDVIDSHTTQFLNGYLLPWKMNSIFDTGLLEKAAQINSPPRSGETLDEWQRRVDRAGSKVKWNMERHCVPKYRLVERYNVDMRAMHTAGFDCLMIHLLFDTYKQLTEILSGTKTQLENIYAGSTVC